MSAVAEMVGAEEARQFADTVAAIVSRHPNVDRWTAGAAVSDQDADLDRELADAGWDELGRDEALLPLAGPAGAALGRAFASLSPIDRLLGGALRIGPLARYATEATALVEPRAARLETTTRSRLDPVPYTDALGVVRIDADHVPGRAPMDGPPAGDLAADDSAGGGVAAGASADGLARVRFDAWCAASVGYIAGLGQAALGLALEHARSRRAFGGPLAALEPVQQMLADAATVVDGLVLLSADSPGSDALAYAGEATERAVAACMQVTGALGFTMEFPLQRAYRRARSARAWADAALIGWEGSARRGAADQGLGA